MSLGDGSGCPDAVRLVDGIVLVLAVLARLSSSLVLGWCVRLTCRRGAGAGGIRASADGTGPFIVPVGAGVVWLSYPLALCWWRLHWCWWRWPARRPRRRWGGVVVPVGIVLVLVAFVLMLAALARSSSSSALG